MQKNKQIDFSERAKKLCGQKTKTLIPLFPLTPTALQSPEIVLSIDDPEAFFAEQAELETKIGRVRSDLLPKERELILATVGSLNYFDLEQFLLTRCNVQDPSKLNWENIFTRLKWFQSKQAEKPAKKTRPSGDASLQVRALALMTANAGITREQLAEKLGCCPTSLNRLPAYRAAKSIVQSSKRDILRGTKYKGCVEAMDDEM